MSYNTCPYCGKIIHREQYLTKYFFKITELCPNCGEAIARSKSGRIMKLGKRQLWLQYSIVVGCYLLIILYVLILLLK